MCYCRSWILHANHPNPFCKVSCMPSHFESNYIGLAFGFRSVTGFGCMRGGCPVKAPVWNKAWRVWVAHCVSCPVIVQRWPFVIYIYIYLYLSISYLYLISIYLYQFLSIYISGIWVLYSAREAAAHGFPCTPPISGSHELHSEQLYSSFTPLLPLVTGLDFRHEGFPRVASLQLGLTWIN